MQKDNPSVRSLPASPGVYLFMGGRREVLYVGKATSLRDRVRSYFAPDLVATRGVHIRDMVEKAHRVDYRVTDSVLEALVLEAHLIKELKPHYNTRDKDDKSFNYLVITTNEVWPRLLTVRGKDLVHTLEILVGDSPRKVPLPVYGPFVHAGQFKDALRLIRRIFPYFDTREPVDVLMARNDKKLSFNQSIGVYPPAHTDARTYKKTIRHIRMFFEGRKKQLMHSLERAMHAAAEVHAFEEAGEYKRQLFALRHIEDVSLIRSEQTYQKGSPMRIEAYDVAHLKGSNMVGVCVVVEDGAPVKAAYRTFNIRDITAADDTAALSQVLTRRLVHTEWMLPRLIVVDGSTAQLNAARKVLDEFGYSIPVVAVTKDEHHRPKSIRGDPSLRNTHRTAILLANSEAHRFSLSRHRRKSGVVLGTHM